MSQGTAPPQLPLDTVLLSSSSSSSLKRRASDSLDCTDDTSRKRVRENGPTSNDDFSPSESSSKFITDMVQELQCGCCSELVYRPVLVMPCQHFFCGSCCVLWIRNGGTSCPACRGPATVAIPFRALQSVVDTLLAAAPSRTRAERERQQADEIYKIGQTIRIPPPREASPAPEMERSADYVHPCPHCTADNPYDWRCPQPVVDPATDIGNAWHVDDGTPPGHGFCGNCESLLALRAPSTTKCDLCNTAFCGIGVQDRCVALPILSQLPHSIITHLDLIQCSDLYDSFEGNNVEVEYMLEYIQAQEITPRHIYRDIVQHIQKQPRGFDVLVEQDLFIDVYGVAPSSEPTAGAPKSRACRMCAAEIFIWGFKEWWVRERQKGFLEEHIMKRPDCPEGRLCIKQKDDNAHAKQYNHIFTTIIPDQIPPEVPAAQDLPPPVPSTTTGPTTIDSTSSLPQTQQVETSSSLTSLSFLLNVDEETPEPQSSASSSDIHSDPMNMDT